MHKQDGSERETPTQPAKSGGGVNALLDWLRRTPDRLKRPETLLMLMAILASLGAHMPPYMGLGALAEYFKAHPRVQPSAPPVEVSFEVDAPPDPQPDDPEPEKADEPKPEDKPEPEKKAEAKLEPKKPEPEKPKPELKISELTVQPAPPPPPPPPQLERKQSITQKSEDPEVEPPPDAKFLAEESRRVEEETVAMVRDQNRDDPLPNPSAPQAAGAEAPGDAREDARGEVGGADVQKPREPAVAMRESAPPPPPSEAPRQPAQRPAQPAQAPAPAIAPGTIIQDPMGSFVLAPANPSQRSQSSQRAARPGESTTNPQAGATSPDLRVSWRAFEDTFGAEQLEKDRMPPGAKRRGAGREKRWSEFRAAIENYITGVKPGNTTALNAAADPFAAYLAAFHRNLHMEFAHEFLGSLPTFGALGNPNLMAKVEIVVNPDGTLDRVGIVKTSGDMMYDFGAFNAVQRGAPYPPTPEKIRSPDGRAYIRWALHRNESQCGTWNAEPYMLRDPPRSPNDPPQDNVPPFRNPLGPKEGKTGRAPAPKLPGGVTRPGETLGFAPDNRVRVRGLHSAFTKSTERNLSRPLHAPACV